MELLVIILIGIAWALGLTACEQLDRINKREERRDEQEDEFRIPMGP
jgi:hypothetical protein